MGHSTTSWNNIISSPLPSAQLQMKTLPSPIVDSITIPRPSQKKRKNLSRPSITPNSCTLTKKSRALTGTWMPSKISKHWISCLKWSWCSWVQVRGRITSRKWSRETFMHSARKGYFKETSRYWRIGVKASWRFMKMSRLFIKLAKRKQEKNLSK